MTNASMLRQLWVRSSGGAALPRLGELAVLDLFSEPQSLDGLAAQGSEAIAAQAQLAAEEDATGDGSSLKQRLVNGLSSWL